MSDSDGSDLAVLTKQMELDYGFIQRNIRDLSTTAQFAHTKELEELHTMAYTNLKEQMGPGRPLAVDPTLVLDAYKTISGVVMMTVETKRKAAETLMKARTLIDVPHTKVDAIDNDVLGEEDVFDEDVSKVSVSTGSGGTGIYGNLVDSKPDPAM